MFVLFLCLAIVSVLGLVAGVAWFLAARGKVERTSGPEVGKEIMSGQMQADDVVDDGQLAVAERSAAVFAGTGAKVEVEAETSFTELKDQLRARDWTQALPTLLVVCGLLGLILFGSLALLMGLENKLLGAVILVVALYALIRVGRDYVRA